MSGTIKRTFVGTARTETLLEISCGRSNDPPHEAPPFPSFMFDQSGKTACYNKVGAKKAVALPLLVSQQRSQTVFTTRGEGRFLGRLQISLQEHTQKSKPGPPGRGLGLKLTTPICKN